MYAIPIFMLLIGLLLLCISIYLLFNDYKYVLEKRKLLLPSSEHYWCFTSTLYSHICDYLFLHSLKNKL